MVEQKLPQENLISLALEFNRIVLLGNYETDPERWDKVTKKLDEKGWKYNIVNTEFRHSALSGSNVIESVEEIRHFVPMILLMDTTKKQQCLDMISYRMEVWGDVQLIWVNQECVLNENDRNDFHAYGWSYVENENFLEILEASEHKLSPPTP